MALINCPECGKEISDKAEICINCGFPISKYLNDKMKHDNDLRIMAEQFVCKSCGYRNKIGTDYCERCGLRITPYVNQQTVPQQNIQPQIQPKQFNGLYKFEYGKQIEIHCPRCGSENCCRVQEQTVIPGKTKTRYTMNLNPFHPFTLANKKEKIVRKDRVNTVEQIMCNQCGYRFF